MLGEIVGDVTFAADGLAVVFERRIEVFAPMAGGEAVIFLEAARVGMIRPLAAVVPFAKAPGRVTGALESLRDRSLIEVSAAPARSKRRGRRRADDIAR